MNKITFEDGSEPALSAENLNQLQTNFENAINAILDQIGVTGGGDTLPIGAMLPFASDTIPSNWLLCNGSAVSRTTYSELFKVIGTKHGTGDGSTTFNLPNVKGRTLVGKDPNDSDFNSIGKTIGSKYIQEHYHEYKYGGTAGGDGSALTYAGTTGTQANKAAIQNVKGVQTGNSGNIQPSFVTNYIIKANMSAVTQGEVIQEDGTASTTNVYSAEAVDKKVKTNITTGQAVATNEYIDGKQVYVKRISFTMSSTLNSWQLIDTLTNYGNLDEMHGSLSTGGEDIIFPTAQSSSEIIKVYIDSKSGGVKVWHTYSYVNGKSCSLTIRYTLK